MSILLLQQLSLGDSEGHGKFNLEALLNRYIERLQNELTVTDVVGVVLVFNKSRWGVLCNWGYSDWYVLFRLCK